MEEINSVSSRRVPAMTNMQNLEKAIYLSDARMKFRVDLNNKARLILGVGFAAPFSAYLLYHYFAPGGVMQNHRASAGAYMYWTQSFLNAPQTPMQVYRPEFYLKE